MIRLNHLMVTSCEPLPLKIAPIPKKQMHEVESIEMESLYGQMKYINLLLIQKSIVNRWLAIVKHRLAIVQHWLAIVTELARLLQFVGSHWLTSL